MRPVNITTVLLTLIVALTFQLYPWSGQGVILRPDFLLVVTLYWVIRAPYLVNVGLSWFAGLIVDLSTGSLLGQHALAFGFAAFLALLYQRRLVLFNRWQLTIYIFVLLIAERAIVLMLKLFADYDNPGLSYFWPVVTSMILWQLMVLMFGAPTRPRH